MVLVRNGVEYGTLVPHICMTYDLVVFTVNLGLYGALVKMNLSRTRLVVERNGVKFDTRESSYVYIR